MTELVRVYLPATLPALADLRQRDELGTPPVAAHAVTPSLREYRMKVFSPPAQPLIAIPAHGKILDALRARDAARAHQAMLAHIEETKADVIGIARSIESQQRSG